MGKAVQYRRGDGVDVEAMLWEGKRPDNPFAGDVKDFRAWAIDCHSQATTTLVTADHGDLAPGDYLVKVYGSGLGAAPTSYDVVDAATVATWRRVVTDPDGSEDWAAFEALGGDEA